MGIMLILYRFVVLVIGAKLREIKYLITIIKVAKLRRNSSREAEEALAGGLSKADIHMPSL